MTRSQIFHTIAVVSMFVLTLIPFALCLGFAVNDTAAYVHRLFALGVFSLATFLVSAVISNL